MNVDSPSPQENETPSEDLGDKNILVLEDEIEQFNTLAPLFEANGFRVTWATNGVDGLRQIMARDYAVILCDMMMPNLPGDLFYRAVERTKPYLCKRFIFITAYSTDREIREFIHSINGVLVSKPFEASELMNRIDSIIRSVR